MPNFRILLYRALNDRRTRRVLSSFDGPLLHPMLAETPDCAKRAVLSRCFFLPKQSLYYARIPKNANSTIAKTLASHAGARRLDDKGRLAKVMFKRIPTPEQFASARKVAFLRHPTERALSAWRDKGMAEKYIRRHQMAGDSTTPPTFLQYLKALEANNYFENAHFLPQTQLIPGNLAEYRLFTVESLEIGLRSLCEEVFGSFNGLNRRRTGQTASRSFLTEVSEDEIHLLRHLYGEDYAVYASLNA